MKKSTPQQFIIKEQAPHARMIYNPSIWQQFPSLLAYPLQGHALPMVIIFPSILWLLSWNPLFSIFGLIVFLCWSLNYAYAVLEQTTLGYATPPALSFQTTWNIINQRPLKQLLCLSLIVATYSSVRTSAGQIPAVIVLFLSLLLIPANVVVIVTQNSLLNALNPLLLFQTIQKIGKVYILLLLMFGLLTALLFYVISSVNLLNAQIINQFSLLPTYIGVFYFGLMTFHLLGFVVYHRRYALGIEVIFSPEREEAAQQEAQAKHFEQILDEVYWLARQQGQTAAAIETLWAKLAELGETIEIHDKLFARLRLWEQKGLALAQGQRYLTLLIQKKQLRQALMIYQTCFELNPQFKLEQPSQILPLAQMAYQQKSDEIAFHLVESFLSHYPNHPDKVAVQFLMVKLLAERLKRLHEAKQLIAQLLKLKNHPLLAEIQKYAKFLKQWQGNNL